MERRAFLHGSAALLASSLVTAGCQSRPTDLKYVIKPEQADFPLVIDVHAHLFNASDLQVSKFITTVAATETNASAIRWLAEVLGPILQNIGWGFAPSAPKELRELGKSVSADMDSVIQVRRDAQYQLAKDELERAARATLNASGRTESELSQDAELNPGDLGISALLDMPDSYTDLYVETPDTGFAFNLGAVRQFLVEMFQYRHVSAINYFSTYGSDSARVDLVTPSLVDFDWWLASGAETKSTLPAQVEVAERIALLSGGAIHPFVPFDPFRQAAWRELQLGAFSPLALVQEAIRDRGAIGVKLYPPMGFAVYDNTRFADSTMWRDKAGLHEFARRPDFARQLDAALDELFDFCASEGVAVMAHSSRSNMAHADYEPLLLAESWRALFANNPGVTTSFGHFSGFGSGREPDHWQQFVDMLTAPSAQDERGRFADLSYFTEVLSDTSELVTRLRTILYDDAGEPTRIFNQLLYGSDWKMLLMEEGSKRYLQSTIEVLQNAETELAAFTGTAGLTGRALGLNALNYLGLKRGQATRARLERFYEKNLMAEPMWMRKADRLTV